MLAFFAPLPNACNGYRAPVAVGLPYRANRGGAVGPLHGRVASAAPWGTSPQTALTTYASMFRSRIIACKLSCGPHAHTDSAVLAGDGRLCEM